MPHDHHDHHDHHGHAHHHPAPKDFGWAFALGIGLNSVFILAEIGWGLRANSLALLADAGHNAGDVLSLALAWGATHLGKKRPSGRFTYGLGSSSIVAALINAAILLIAVGGIGWEALARLFAHPEASGGLVVMGVAAAGVLINGATALLFMRGREHDLNIRGAWLHMAADAAISFGVVISGGIILFTGWLWVDPIVSLLIAVAIAIGSYGLLRDSVNLSLHAAPAGIEVDAVRAAIESCPGVTAVHDLHVWALSTTETACSAHVVTPAGHPGDAWLERLSHRLAHDFDIRHATIQIELGEHGEDCPIGTDHA